MADEIPVQKVLLLSCSAQRLNKQYLKEDESVYDDEGKFLYIKHSNKTLIRYALALDQIDNSVVEPGRCSQLTIEDCDKELAEKIRNYYRRLMFSAIKGDNEFQTEIFSLLMNENMSKNKIGFIASLPSVYDRDVDRNRMKKIFQEADDNFLSEIGAVILNKDCEILQVTRSKNFDAWNVCAIIDNKIVSWMSSKDVKVGPAVLIKAKTKQHAINWISQKRETRLNYVKVAQ